jgi:hypothetical protein
MNEPIHPVAPATENMQPTSPPVADAAQETVAVNVAAQEPAASGPGGSSNRHAEAGRKGAVRVHQLRELGLLYEKEHGLKRGRQRRRQLIQEGRLYEQEHGLSTGPRRRRRDRLAGDQLVESFLRSLVRMVKPSYRGKLLRMLQTLEEAA